MEPLTALASVIAAIVSIAGLMKIVIEVKSMPRLAQRAEYEFADKIAQRTQDPVAKSYAEELGYRALINDDELTNDQRKALLTLPNRVKLIPLYLKARRLLNVGTQAPVLTWKAQRHASPRYRNFVAWGLYCAYLVFAMLGFPAMFGPYPSTPFALLNAVLKLPLWVSVCLIFLAAVCLFNALTLASASSLVRAANSVVPAGDEHDRD